MMSMSGGWFFVVASEAITVGDTTIALPGVGSYIAKANDEGNWSAIGAAVLTMGIVILLYDQLLFRPIVAWAGKFKVELSQSQDVGGSWVLNLLPAHLLDPPWRPPRLRGVSRHKPPANSASPPRAGEAQRSRNSLREFSTRSRFSLSWRQQYGPPGSRSLISGRRSAGTKCFMSSSSRLTPSFACSS